MNKERLRELVSQSDEGNPRLTASRTELTEKMIREYMDDSIESNPTIKSVRKLAKHFGVPMAELLKEEE